MTNCTAQQDVALQTAEALRRRGDLRKGGLNIFIREVIERWDKSMPQVVLLPLRSGAFMPTSEPEPASGKESAITGE